MNVLRSLPNTHLLAKLSVAYTQPHRYYHNLSHIGDMLGRAAHLEHFSEAQCLAVWFHDVIYHPGAKDNEWQSALFARAELLRLYRADGCLETDVNKVANMVLDTETHHANSKESEIIIDLDLAMFQESHEVYNMNVGRIYLEYFPSANPLHYASDDAPFLDNAKQAWIAGRGKFLERMLKRDPFYYTQDTGELQLDARDAYANIRMELDALRAGRLLCWEQWRRD